MNLDRKQIATLCDLIAKAAAERGEVEIGVFPPFPYIGFTTRKLKDTGVVVGGQDLYHEAKGAFTGAVSGSMLTDMGATHVLIGHSERRHIFGDSPEDTAKKMRAALDADLIPVFCVGEKLPEREAGRTGEVVVEQLAKGLDGFPEQELKTMVIAYEPVWAIGTGKTASPEQAGEAHSIVREWFASEYSGAFAENVRILYGGSVTPDNVDSLMAVDGVDGTLVGGASLKPELFDRIMRYNP
jgi:triosephosphate isomerase